MSYETLVTIGVIIGRIFLRQYVILYIKYLTRRMRIQYEGGYMKKKLKNSLKKNWIPSKGKAK